ncbi:hypothetical protein [Aliagarivorans marinus]|uniref:hypothetical protein n=1 Tax=Aliagarivorans marinus TaxID=561965 RepID=UPI000427DF4F|nr:hypothetical protein [Aliagarivorans marinus]
MDSTTSRSSLPHYLALGVLLLTNLYYCQYVILDLSEGRLPLVWVITMLMDDPLPIWGLVLFSQIFTIGLTLAFVVITVMALQKNPHWQKSVKPLALLTMIRQLAMPIAYPIAIFFSYQDATLNGSVFAHIERGLIGAFSPAEPMAWLSYLLLISAGYLLANQGSSKGVRARRKGPMSDSERLAAMQQQNR